MKHQKFNKSRPQNFQRRKEKLKQQSQPRSQKAQQAGVSQQPQYMKRKRAEGFKSNALFFSGIDGDSMISLPFNVGETGEIVFGETYALCEIPEMQAQLDEVTRIAERAMQENEKNFVVTFRKGESRFYALVKPATLAVELETVAAAFHAYVSSLPDASLSFVVDESADDSAAPEQSDESEQR